MWETAIDVDKLQNHIREMFVGNKQISEAHVIALAQLVKSEMGEWTKQHWCHKLADDFTMTHEDIAKFVASNVKVDPEKGQHRWSTHWAATKVQPVTYIPDAKVPADFSNDVIEDFREKE